MKKRGQATFRSRFAPWLRRHARAKSSLSPFSRGFTLLEVVIALAILGMSMTAIFNINSNAIYSHVYAKKLTVATLLARSKMTDIEQELYDKGFQIDDDEMGGDFSDEGWPSYKWRAKIIAPKTNGVSPDKLIGAIFGIPTGGKSDPSGIGALAGMFGSAGKPPGSSTAAPVPGMGDPQNSILSAMGPASGLIQTQFQTLIDQITKAVREVHLTVTWKEGKLTESFDIVTHIVSLGPGSDRNGGMAAEQSAKAGVNSAPGATGDQWVRADTGAPVANPIPAPNGAGMVDSTGAALVTASQYAQMKGGMPGAGMPGAPGGLNNINSLINSPRTLSPSLLRGGALRGQ